ncbi:MAG TPA: hypothetical protein VLT62_04780 [Candidatus Methylomirabilis sp.]|nr:hypothetical protein [Candidatus Methylomirabilis sp.]
MKTRLSQLIQKGRKILGHERAARPGKILGRSQQQFVLLALQELANESGLRMNGRFTQATTLSPSTLVSVTEHVNF